MDLRLFIVFGPVIVALSWAAINIGSAALKQLQGFTEEAPAPQRGGRRR